jgi:hypothetical protein
VSPRHPSTEAAPGKPARAGRFHPPLSACFGHGDLGTSLLFVFPLFLIYGVGVAFAPVMNGVDFVSRNLFAVVGYDRGRYLLVHGALLIGFVVLLLYLRRRKAFHARRFPPMVLESAIYALTLGSLIWFVMRKLLGFAPLGLAGDPLQSLAPVQHLPPLATSTASEPSGATAFILSIGAGVHEELVFRLGMLSGGAALLRVCRLGHGVSIAIAFVASSALFSAAHHVGAAGDPWALDVFVYRLLAGLLFAAIYYWRSLAHAVYTHALYDVYVMLIK